MFGGGQVTGECPVAHGWLDFSPAEQRRLAAKYVGVDEGRIDAEALARTGEWFDGIGETQRLSLLNAVCALGGRDWCPAERRALWAEIERLLPGKWNSNIGAVSVIVELRDPERFKAAALSAGLREDWSWVRDRFHAGASFSLREWRVRASLNIANDVAAAQGVGEESGGGRIARCEFDAFGPSFGPLGLLRHKFGKIDAGSARAELARRGFFPASGDHTDLG
ncbi:MAG TPA: hypothetical protein VFC61_02415 [Blastocatellia bacterium]|nr:hypothetical protein [Blastocatellia bacterium]